MKICFDLYDRGSSGLLFIGDVFVTINSAVAMGRSVRVDCVLIVYDSHMFRATVE